MYFIHRDYMPLINGVKFYSKFIYNLKGINFLQLVYLNYVILYILINMQTQMVAYNRSVCRLRYSHIMLLYTFPFLL